MEPNSNDVSKESGLSENLTPQTLQGIEVPPMETAPQSKHLDFPDGGLTAWLQVLGCFFLWFNSWYLFD